MPLVTVVMPTYNRAHMLPAAVETVREQTLADWELLIVDDGSTDGTPALLGRWSREDERIRSVRQENRGQSAARNRALDLARGEYVAYLDSDNALLPECLEVLTDALRVRPDKSYAMPQGSRVLELWEDGRLVRSVDTTAEEFPPELSLQDIVHRRIHTDMNGFLHRRELTDAGVRFAEDIRRMEDWEFFLQLAERFPEGFLYVPRVLYPYTRRYGGDGAVSNTSYAEWADLFEAIYAKHKNDRLMAGQTWYPDRVTKWRAMQEQFERGEAPPPHLYRFS